MKWKKVGRIEHLEAIIGPTHTDNQRLREENEYLQNENRYLLSMVKTLRAAPPGAVAASFLEASLSARINELTADLVGATMRADVLARKVGRVELWAVGCRMTNAAGHTAAYDLRADISSSLDELDAILSDGEETE